MDKRTGGRAIQVVGCFFVVFTFILITSYFISSHLHRMTEKMTNDETASKALVALRDLRENRQNMLNSLDDAPFFLGTKKFSISSKKLELAEEIRSLDERIRGIEKTMEVKENPPISLPPVVSAAE